MSSKAVFEALGFTPEQVEMLTPLARDWAFLTARSVEDAAIDIGGAYRAHPKSNRRQRMVERLGADPFGGTPEDLIDGLHERIGGAAPSWYGDTRPAPGHDLIEALAAPFAPLLARLSRKIARKSP